MRSLIWMFLFQLQELHKLRPLKDLNVLTVADNPVAQLNHCRAYIVFHMVTLETLDCQRITLQERHHANTRFGQGRYKIRKFVKNV